MARIRGFRRVFRFPWRTLRQVRQDVDDELEFHISEKTDALVRAGWSPKDARREALGQFGDFHRARRDLVRQDSKGERRYMLRQMIDDLIRDVRFACRSLARNPTFSLVSVLVLALGIGVLSMMLNLVSMFAFRPALIEAPDALRAVYIRDEDTPGRWPSFSFDEYSAMRNETRAFASLAAFELDTVGIGSGEGGERGVAEFVSDNYFQTLGVPLSRGRSFTPEEVAGDAPATVILGHELWTRLGRDPGILGSTIDVSGEPLVVIGVAPERFTGTVRLLAPQLWLPVAFLDRTTPGALRQPGAATGLRELMLFGRIGDGVEPTDLDAELGVLASRTRALGLGLEEGRYSYVSTKLPRVGISNAPQDETWLLVPVVILIGMGGIVLAIACLDLANMLLARGAGRQAEMAVRRSLGGGRARLLRQLLTEGLVLSSFAGIVGFLGAYAATGWLTSSARRLAPAGLNVFADTQLDGGVVLATVGACIVATVFFALGPAWRITGRAVFPVLKSGAAGAGALLSPGRRRLFAARNLMIAAQIALSLAMLVAGGLFLRASSLAAAVSPGFDVERGLIAELDPALVGFDEIQARDLSGRLIDRLRALPEIENVATTSIIPFAGITRSVSVQEAGSISGDAAMTAYNYAVSDGYFDTLKMPILRGRDFSQSEARTADGPRVAIIDEPLARSLFPGRDPLGQFLHFAPSEPGAEPVPIEIVGIVSGKRHRLSDAGPSPHVYLPAGQSIQSQPYLHLRVDPRLSDASAALEVVRSAIEEVDPTVPLYGLSSFEALLENNPELVLIRFGGALFAWLGVAALFLALVGIYGVTAFLISQRTRELGIRMALGATRQHLTRQILREHTGTAILGLAVGLALSLAAGQILASLLYEVSPSDPLVLGSAMIFLGIAATLAAYLPVRRATAIEPTAALRYE